MQGWYDLYRGYYKGSWDKGWNNVHVPLLFSVVMTDVARMHGITFGGTESPISAVPTGFEDVREARRIEKLFVAQSEAVKLRMDAVRFYLHANIYGTAIGRYGYEKNYGPAWRPMGQARGTALRGKRMVQSNVLKYEGPTFKPVDIVDVLPTPGQQDIQKMGGFAQRYYLPFDDIIAGCYAGPDGEAHIYDPEEVAKMGSSRPNSTITADMNSRKSMAAGGVDEKTWAQLSMNDKPAEVWDVFMRVPRELGVWYDPETGLWDEEQFGDASFTTELLITLADRGFVLYAGPNPHVLQEKPFLAYRPHEDPHYFFAPGKIEIGLKMQVATNRLANTQLDAYDMWVNPPWLADLSRVDPKLLRLGPGKVNGVWGPVTDDVIQQLRPDMQGVRDIFPQLAQLWKWMQQATGISEDVSQGMATSKRQTAFEVNARQDATGVRLGLEASLAEMQFIEPLCRAWHELNRQYLPIEVAMDMIGGHQIWDEATGTYMQGPPDFISLSGMLADYNFRATGATRLLGRAAKQQNMMGLLQYLPMLVQLMPTFNGYAFGRQMLPLFDLTNVDEIAGSQQVAEAIYQADIVRRALGGPPSEKGPGNGSGTGFGESEPGGSGQAEEGGGAPELPGMGGGFGPPGGVGGQLAGAGFGI